MIEWKGGECPVAPTERVNYRMRDGSFKRGRQAGELDWANTGTLFDIVEWEYASPIARLRLTDSPEVLTFGSLMPKTFKRVLFNPQTGEITDLPASTNENSAAEVKSLADVILPGFTPRNINESQRRKNQPVMRGALDYFPDALLAVSELSRIANDKHNPGEPMHWSKGKSNDHADCCVRHLMERGKWDTTMSEPVRHSTAAAWRALANLQTEIELEREAAGERRAA